MPRLVTSVRVSSTRSQPGRASFRTPPRMLHGRCLTRRGQRRRRRGTGAASRWRTCRGGRWCRRGACPPWCPSSARRCTGTCAAACRGAPAPPATVGPLAFSDMQLPNSAWLSSIRTYLFGPVSCRAAKPSSAPDSSWKCSASCVQPGCPCAGCGGVHVLGAGARLPPRAPAAADGRRGARPAHRRCPRSRGASAVSHW